ncbi:MAG: hypothetical protein QXI19_03550 [Candidatus Caldarchaeum sp.]
MTKSILWLSRHQPLPAQVDALRNHYGEVMLFQDASPFASAEEILERYRRGGYDDCVVVAPLSVLQRLVELGLRPLWAEMEKVEKYQNPATDTIVGDRVFRFKRFRRVVGMKIEYEDL